MSPAPPPSTESFKSAAEAGGAAIGFLFGVVAILKWVVPWLFRQVGDYAYATERRENADTRAAVREITASQARTEAAVASLAERFDAHAEQVQTDLTELAKQLGRVQGAQDAMQRYDRRSTT